MFGFVRRSRSELIENSLMHAEDGAFSGWDVREFVLPEGSIKQFSRQRRDFLFNSLRFVMWHERKSGQSVNKEEISRDGTLGTLNVSRDRSLTEARQRSRRRQGYPSAKSRKDDRDASGNGVRGFKTQFVDSKKVELWCDTVEH